MFILFTNLFLARPFRLENTLECYNLRGGQGGSTEVKISFITSFQKVFCVFLNEEISYLYNSTIFRMLLIVFVFFVNSIIFYLQNFPFRKWFPNMEMSKNKWLQKHWNKCNSLTSHSIKNLKTDLKFYTYFTSKQNLVYLF